MDIFKLGDKILALLEAVFGFWNNQISLVFAMLGQSPVSFKGGGPWAVIEGIEPVFVAVGSSLVVLFFVIGFCSESIDVKDEMRFESIFRMLIRLGLAEWFVANNVTIMKAYDNLEAEGMTVTVHGKGTYVAASNIQLMEEERRKEVEADLEAAIQKGRRCGMKGEEIRSLFELIMEDE